MCNNCNPCDDCAPKCHECCNPNIQGDGCVTIDQSEEGVITISAPCPTEVTSDDGTIGVTKKEPHDGYSERFDLTVNKEDRLVAACGADAQPGTLNDKLEEGIGIDIYPVNCGEGKNAKIRIEVDKDELNIPNDMVAVSANCSPDETGYLSDVLKSTSDAVEFVQQGCQYVLRDRANKEFVGAKCILTNTVIGDIRGGVDGFAYYLGNSTYNNDPSTQTGAEGGLRANWTYPILSNVEETDGGLKILKKGIYQVSFYMSVEMSFGIHGMRGGLFLQKNNSSGKELVCEGRFAAPMGQTPYQQQHSEDPDYNGTIMKLETEAESLSGDFSASLGASVHRVTCNGYTLIELNYGDILFLGVKGQTRTKYKSGTSIDWENEDGQVAVLGMDGSGGGSGGQGDCGAQISAFRLYSL